MRIREKTYNDYGITEDEKRYIMDFCRNANESEKLLIKTALSELNPYISPYIFYSLVDNLSYDDICKREYIYMCCVDFYAYRRQGIAAIKRWMILNGIWELQ